MTSNALFALSIVGEMVPNILLGVHFQDVQLNVFKNANAPLIWSTFNFVKAFALLAQGQWIGSVRRRSLLLTSLLPIFVATSWLLWLPPTRLPFFTDDNQFARSLFTFAVLTANGLALNAFTLCRATMFAQIDAKARGTVAAVQQLFMVVSIVIGVAVPPVLTASFEDTTPLCVLLSAVAVLCTGAAVYFARRLDGSDAAAAAATSEAMQRSKRSSLVATFRSALSDASSFKHLLLAWVLSNLSLSVLMSTTALYYRYFFGGISQVQISMLQGGGQLGAALLTPLWLRARSKLGTARTWQLSALGFAVVLACHFGADGSLAHLAALELVGAAFLSGLFVLPNMSVADVAEHDADAHSHGRNRIGVFQSLVGFALTLSSVLQGIISGAVMRAGGYDAQLDAAEQPESALVAMRALVAIVPPVLLALSAVAIARFRVPIATHRSKEIKLE
jgi:Na+/melibiose symporter-like transporter